MSMKIVMIPFIGFAAVISMTVAAETRLLAYYCAEQEATSEQVVSVLDGETVMTFEGDRLTKRGLQQVKEPEYLVNAVNRSLNVTPDCTQYVLKRYQHAPEARVTFDFDKATLHPSSQLVINKVLGEKKTFIVSGHTDAIGTEGYNQDLGQRRADSVMNYLQDKGVSTDQIEAKSYGESLPVKSNHSNRGRAINRRVDISFTE